MATEDFTATQRQSIFFKRVSPTDDGELAFNVPSTEFKNDVRFTFGTGTNQSQNYYYATPSVDNVTPFTIDLQSITNDLSENINFATIKGVYIEFLTGGDTTQLLVDSPLLAGTGEVILNKGDILSITSPDGYTVTGVNNTFTLSYASATAATPVLILYGTVV